MSEWSLHFQASTIARRKSNPLTEDQVLTEDFESGEIPQDKRLTLRYHRDIREQTSGE
jgi:hypothetical protein